MNEGRGARAFAGKQAIELINVWVALDDLPAQDFPDSILNAKILEEFVHAPVAQRGLPLKGPHDRPLEGRRDGHAVRSWRRYPSLELARHDFLDGLACEWMASGEGLVCHHAYGIDVTSNVAGGAFPDLRRDVPGSTGHVLFGPSGTSHPDVREFHDATITQENVRGLQVTVDLAVRVKVGKRAADAL